jgi:hypothetical protein
MRHTLKIALLLVLIPGLLLAQGTRGPKGGAPIGPLYKTTGAPFSTVMDINNVTIWTKAEGWHPNVHLGYSAGTFPKNTLTTGYAAGWLFGGQVQDGATPVVRVGGGLDRPGMHAGKILPITGSGPVTGYEDPASANVRIWRVRPDWQSADLRDDAAQFFDKALSAVTQADMDQLRAQYQTDWNEWPANKGAPFQYGQGRSAPAQYDPTKDVPGIAGAGQTAWTVANDLDPGLASSFYGSPPTGIEFQLTLWGYASSTPLNNCVFYRAKYIYRGTQTTPPGSFIDSMFVTYWIDTDLGDYTDDYVGCDTTLNLGYGYNSSAVDHDFAAIGLPPPADGTIFLQGVATYTGNLNDSAIVNLQIRHGWKYVNSRPMAGFGRGSAGVVEPDYPGGAYVGSLQWYNQMRGYLPKPPYPAGNPLVNPTTGQSTRYAVSGDPVAHTGWLDGSDFQAGDRRYNLTSGPFRMALGDTAEVVSSFVGGMGADNLSSVTVMKYNATFAQYAYDNLFVLPSPPPPPAVTVAELDGDLVLYWGQDMARVAQTEQVVTKGFAFEGYNVYQFPSTNANISSAVRIATYDVVNDVTVIVDKAIDPQTGVIVIKPVEFGKNSGVSRLINIRRDALLDKPVVNGQNYYFAVTAYSYNSDPNVPFHALESAPILIQARPQTSKPGVRYLSSIGDTIVANKGVGVSDGKTLALVVDPSRVTGHSYQVQFDTLAGNPVWNLVDKTTNQTVLRNQTNQSGDDNYPIVDGMMVKVFGAPDDFKRFAMVTNGAGAITSKVGFDITPAPTYNAYSADWYRDVATGAGSILNLPNGMQTGGGWYFVTGFATDADYATAVNSWSGNRVLWPKMIPYDYEIRFTAAGGKAWLGFSTKALIDVPFELWRIGIGTPGDPSDDVRLIPVILDDNSNGAFDFHLDHAASGGNNDPYCDPIYWYLPDANPTPGHAGYDAAIARMGPSYDFTTEVRVIRGFTLMNWNQRQGGNPGPETAMPDVGTVIRLETTKPNQLTTTYAFTAPSVGSSKDYALADVNLINVFPNPYYGFNLRETNRLEKYVTFSHLPRHAILRIYTIGASLVRTLEKDDDTQFTNWNLRNQNNLPVASGIYIVHVTLPDIGATKILKVAVVQEDQFLKIY